MFDHTRRLRHRYWSSECRQSFHRGFALSSEVAPPEAIAVYPENSRNPARIKALRLSGHTHDFFHVDFVGI